jgi:hypothetical protein
MYLLGCNAVQSVESRKVLEEYVALIFYVEA